MSSLKDIFRLSSRYPEPELIRTSEFPAADMAPFMKAQLGISWDNRTKPIHLRAQHEGEDEYVVMIGYKSSDVPGMIEGLPLQLNYRWTLSEALQTLNSFQQFGDDFSERVSVKGGTHEHANYTKKGDKDPNHIDRVKKQMARHGLIADLTEVRAPLSASDLAFIRRGSRGM